MARVFRSLRKTLVHHLHHHHHHHHHQKLLLPQLARRTYLSEMRNEAFEGNMLRLLRREIQYELQSSPPNQATTSKFDSFVVDGRPGERWITLKRQYANEDIKVEATMFDGVAPAPTTSGGVANADEEQMHITVIVSISKGNSSYLEIMCSAWPDSIEINRLVTRSDENMSDNPYSGPEFKELDDELQDRLYDFLEVRGINDELAVFLHGYMKGKDKTEFIKWMERIKSFIERK
ncbi:uncharacterized protein At2g39795, mitochondrial-like [Arachis stenosperma]|uniref:uncharacterized protein At2g39795, mitochondrial-like n=1 Tax=Arachis stenosperma TaxID=217475 RepID=UPI0025ABC1FC|nr:uncharacterized protein At2g39795, mitochondrial-like [Arachis stenosperma]